MNPSPETPAPPPPSSGYAGTQGEAKSDTPRTNDFLLKEHVANDGMWADFARQLERELEEVRAARRDEESWWAEKHNYQARAEQAEAQLAAKEREVGQLKQLLKEAEGAMEGVREHLEGIRDYAQSGGDMPLVEDATTALALLPRLREASKDKAGGAAPGGL